MKLLHPFYGSRSVHDLMIPTEFMLHPVPPDIIPQSFSFLFIPALFVAFFHLIPPLVRNQRLPQIHGGPSVPPVKQLWLARRRHPIRIHHGIVIHRGISLHQGILRFIQCLDAFESSHGGQSSLLLLDSLLCRQLGAFGGLRLNYFEFLAQSFQFLDLHRIQPSL